MAIEPRWMGGHETDVCLTCRIVYIGPDKHSMAVPHPEDLLTPAGDSTLIQDRADAIVSHIESEEKRKIVRDKLIGPPAGNLLKHFPNLLMLPIEDSRRKITKTVWASYSMMTMCILIFGCMQIFDGRYVIESLGFIPNESARGFGLTALSSMFVHAGWAHLVFNLYFFWMFSDDVEDDLGHRGFFWFALVSGLFIAGFTHSYSSSPELPHVGLSGFITACMAYYALSFPKHRVVYLLPTLGMITAPALGTIKYAFLRTMLARVQIPVWVFMIFFGLKEFFYYTVFERNSLTNVSHSAHLGGIVAGFLFWYLFARRRQKAEHKLVKESDAVTDLLLEKGPLGKSALESGAIGKIESGSSAHQ